jgi:hypothetical protein
MATSPLFENGGFPVGHARRNVPDIEQQEHAQEAMKTR